MFKLASVLGCSREAPPPTSAPVGRAAFLLLTLHTVFPCHDATPCCCEASGGVSRTHTVATGPVLHPAGPQRCPCLRPVMGCRRDCCVCAEVLRSHVSSAGGQKSTNSTGYVPANNWPHFRFRPTPDSLILCPTHSAPAPACCLASRRVVVAVVCFFAPHWCALLRLSVVSM
jgi:hypothetical protein